MNDTKTFELYQNAATIGTFQFESPGMQKYLRDLKPDKFDDLIAMNALFRPGPMAYIPKFIDRKFGREAIAYDLPEMQEYLEETYGITVYQEQVMLVAQKIAGFSKGDADMLRKAMGKKQIQVLDKMKEKFMIGASEKNHPADKLEKIWSDWEAFAQYAFNKSHSTCYAYVAYQTAYLKAHYPSEYMASVLNNAGSTDKITFFMEECKRMGLKVLGADINESLKGFAVNKKGEIRFGLNAPKGVGEAAVENIIEERRKNGPYQNIFDFIKRVNQRSVNKRTLESLIYAGAFDCFPEYHRAQYFAIAPGDTYSGIEKIIKYGQNLNTHNAATTNTLFGNLADAIKIPHPRLIDCEPMSLIEKLGHEKELTGMYLSGHPLDHYQFEIKNYGITPISDLLEFKESIKSQPNPGRAFKIIALIVEANHKIAKNGNKYGSFVIEDFTGRTEFPLFSEDFLRLSPMLVKGASVMINCYFRQQYNKDEFVLKITSVMLAETIKKTLTRQLTIHLQPAHINKEMLWFVENYLKKNKGKTSFKIMLTDFPQRLKISLVTTGTGIELNDDLILFLESNVQFDYQVTTI